MDALEALFMHVRNNPEQWQVVWDAMDLMEKHFRNQSPCPACPHSDEVGNEKEVCMDCEKWAAFLGGQTDDR
jgi:hypothetical protein